MSNSFQSNNFDYLSGKVSSANIVGNRNSNDNVNKTNTASNLLSNNLSLQYAINATQHSLHFPSNFPLKKLPKRLLLAQNLTEFEKQNIECSIVSSCLSSSPAKSLTLSKLMKSIKSSYFNDVRIDSVKCHLIDNIDEVKIALKRLQSTGSVDVSICNATENTGKNLYSLFSALISCLFFLFYLRISRIFLLNLISLFFSLPSNYLSFQITPFSLHSFFVTVAF